MKLEIDPDLACEMMEASGAISLKGFKIKEIVWNRSYDRFEVTFEKGPLDQGYIASPNKVRDQLGGTPYDGQGPRPTTPPFVPNRDDVL